MATCLASAGSGTSELFRPFGTGAARHRRSRHAAGTAESPCSLVDLLPTMLDFAGAADMPLGQPVDGRSLALMARGGPADDGEAIGEYCAEMTAGPVVMIRRGSLKYVHCDDDPAQLYDLASDPCERANLAADPAWPKPPLRSRPTWRRAGTPARFANMSSPARPRAAPSTTMQHGRRTDWDPIRIATRRRNMSATISTGRWLPSRHGIRHRTGARRGNACHGPEDGLIRRGRRDAADKYTLGRL